MLGTYASALLICMAAIIIGRGICLLAGHEGSTWLAPAVGLAALLVVCDVTIGLPGRGWTAVAAVVVLCAGSVWVGVRRRATWPPLSDALPVALVVLVYLSVPFIANDRVGVLGISILNDTHWHLFLAQGLLEPAIKPLDTYGPGYPLGPHAIAATFAQGLGAGVDQTFTGLLIATPVLTGLTALGALRDLSRPRRLLVAVLVAIPYLAAAWYVQSAFKEPIMSLLMLGLVVALITGRAQRFARPLAILVPAAVLIAGVLYDYSYPGLLWPVAIVACWLALEFTLGGAWRRLRGIVRKVRSSGPELVIGVLILVLLLAPDINRIHTFWLSSGGTGVGTVGGVTETSLANLAAPLSALEGLNVWLIGDFRFVPTHSLHAGLLVGLAVIVLVFAIVSALERRELVWPAAILGCALVYVYTKHAQSPYVAAKALAVPAPLVVLGSGGELMRRLEKRVNWRSFPVLAIAAGAILFFVLSFQSSYLVLRDAQVGPDNHFSELRSLRPLLHDRPTLALFYDDYLKWELLGVPVSSPFIQSPIPVAVQPAKPWSYGQAIDFDSFDAATLNQFDYVITTRTAAQSEPPANFRLIGGSRSYEVWQRIGSTTPRLVLPESGHPGAVLDCRTPAGLALSRRHGLARVRPAPRYFNVAPLGPGGSEEVVLDLPAGGWELSLPFLSQQAVSVTGAGLRVQLPPNLDRPGSIWPVGRIQSAGQPVTLKLTMADPGLISSADPISQYFAPQQMVAVPEIPAQTLPLRAACGRYVDWYELS